MADMHVIGSVLEIAGKRFVAVGHRVARDGDQMGLGYLVVPYPLGYVTPMSISLVPASAVSSVVHEGYANDQGASYLADFGNLVDQSAGIPASEYEASAKLLSDFMQKGGGNG